MRSFCFVLALTLLLSSLSAQTLIGQPLIGPSDRRAPATAFGLAVDITADGRQLVVGEPEYRRGPTDDAARGRIVSFRLRNGNWRPDLPLPADAYGDHCGYDLALNDDGRYLAVTCYESGDRGEFQGAVRVYETDGTTFVPRDEPVYGRAANDLFGETLLFSADGQSFLARGYRSAEDLHQPHLAVYVRRAGEWQRRGEPIVSPPDAGVDFSQVAFSSRGDRLAYRVYLPQEAVWVVVVVEWRAGEWQVLGEPLRGRQPSDFFGSALAFAADGDRLLVTSNPNPRAFGSELGYLATYDYAAGRFQLAAPPYFLPDTRESISGTLLAAADGRFVATVALELTSLFAPPVGASVRFLEATAGAWRPTGVRIPVNLAAYETYALSAAGGAFVVGEPNYLSTVNGNEFRGRVRVFDTGRGTTAVRRPPVTEPLGAYPNPLPVGEVLRLDLTTDFPSPRWLTLHAPDGRLVLERNLGGTGSRIRLPELPTGVYAVRVVGGARSARARLVVRRAAP